MHPIRIALIGVNRYSHSMQIYTRILEMKDMFDVVGIAFPEDEKNLMPERTKHFSHLPELTIAQIMDDPTIEAVAIETEEIYCTKYALLAAKAGKHIHMEKPGGLELADFEELVATVKEKDLVFCPGYMYRYNPYIQELFAAIEAGVLGEITSVEAQMNCHHKDFVREWLGLFPGGMMFFLGCHLIDLIYRIQGAPNQIHVLNRSTEKNGITALDSGCAVLEYDHGVSFARCSATELGGYHRRQLVVTGTKGTWELKPLEWGSGENIVTQRNIYTEASWHDPGKASTCAPFDRYKVMLTHFVRCVRKEQENEFTPDYELALYKLLLQCCGV